MIHFLFVDQPVFSQYSALENFSDEIILKWFKAVIRVARERIVKDTPKRGKLTKRQVQRAVEKVVYARRGNGKTGQTQGKKKK